MAPIETVPLFDDNPPISRSAPPDLRAHRHQRLRMHLLSADATIGRALSREAERQPIDILQDLEDLVAITQNAQHAAAAIARAEGMTWTQIGEQLGISRQAAQQRYPL